MADISYHLDTIHGAPAFDNPGGAVQAAAKLAVKAELAAKLAAVDKSNGIGLLIHDTGQGHFALWLARYLKAAGSEKYRWILTDRNILALGTARAALGGSGISSSIIPAADIFLDRKRLADAGGDGFNFITYLPETVPDSKAAWEGMSCLAVPGCIVIAGMTSAEAERFDRKKPSAWRRMGDVKRNGFRAMMYQVQ